MVAPAVISEYVDHELSANLDSTFAFEGPEKLLEIWCWPDEDIDIVKDSVSFTDNGIKLQGLRTIPFDNWVKILDLVSCKILSVKSSKYMDAYLLSESSLFVFPHKVILKTCGTTTTLFCLDELFEVIQKFISKKFTSKDIYKIFYSRRSFMFPEKQQLIHKDWKNEVKLLDNHFINGKSYVVGNSNCDDHWYLYTGGKIELEEEDCEMDSEVESDIFKLRDQTFEILMTDLHPENAEQFVTSRTPGYQSLINDGAEEDDLGHEFGLKTMASSKLDSVFDKDYNFQDLPSPKEIGDDGLDVSDLNFIHDAFSFSPCGYSSNSISANNGGYYYTLHITPESGWSYASFETNYPFSSNSVSISDVLFKVLKIFKPGKFSVTLISEEDSNDEIFSSLAKCDKALKKINYKKNEKIIYDLNNNYKLLYLHFEKN